MPLMEAKLIEGVFTEEQITLACNPPRASRKTQHVTAANGVRKAILWFRCYTSCRFFAMC
jgi:hypothetical protein